jgi:CRP/FNR family cyclic AMP-dependent transcriptional regulator
MYMSESTKEFLCKIPFFIDHSIDDLNTISKITFLAKYKAGEIIFEEGTHGDFICFLVDGQVEILKMNSTGTKKSFFRLYPPSVFGEMALIENSIRSATVIAKTDVEIGIIRRNDFETIILNHPTLGVHIVRKIAKILSSRLRKANSKFIEFV